MLNELDRAPLGSADQLDEPSLALDQRQVVTVMLERVEPLHIICREFGFSAGLRIDLPSIENSGRGS
jgi:hypothetical protein